MTKIEKASPQDARQFAALEQATDVREFVMPYSYATHLEKMEDPSLVYLRILNNEALAGFFLLALDPDQISVEFRRIVVSTKGKGIGQAAIALMESFCRDTLRRSRIWLDVFEHNARGRHIYEKLGYRKFGTKEHAAGNLLLYEKHI